MQQCRVRMQEKRREIFNAKRMGISVDSNEQNLRDNLLEIVRKEFSDLMTLTGTNLSLTGPLSEEDILDLEKAIVDEEGKLISVLNKLN